MPPALPEPNFVAWELPRGPLECALPALRFHSRLLLPTMMLAMWFSSSDRDG